MSYHLQELRDVRDAGYGQGLTDGYATGKSEAEQTLRDQFAMAALPVCINHNHPHSRAAEQAYAYADAMLEARKKKDPTNDK